MGLLSGVVHNIGGMLNNLVGGTAQAATDVSKYQVGQVAQGAQAQTGIDWGSVATNVLSGLGGAAAGGAAGYAAGTYVASGARRRRRRKRRYPTANQWARFEQANDMLKGHPNAPAMRRQLSWKFFSQFKWM
jgi:hypothetical protein